MQAVKVQAQPEGGNGAYLFDEDGFLLDHTLWSEQLGRAIAETEGVGLLSDAHWSVIEHVRNKYFGLGALPNIRQVCRATSLSRTQVHLLFGSCLAIWRIAGLPNPGEEAKTYLM